MTNNTLSDRASLWTPAEKTQRDNGWRYSFAEIESVRDRAKSDTGYGGDLEFAEAVMAIADERLAKREITQSTADRVAELEAALADAAAMLAWAARAMKGNCSGRDVNAVMLAAGKATEARTTLKESSDEKDNVHGGGSDGK